MAKKFVLVISFLFILVFFVTGCNISIGDGPPVSIEKAKKQLSQLGFTPIGMHFVMDFPYKERPWICLCKNSKNEEWGVVLYPDGRVGKVQLGVNNNKTKAQMVDKLVSLGYTHNEYMDNALTLTVSQKGDFYWSYHPVQNDGSTVLTFNLAGEEIKSTK